MRESIKLLSERAPKSIADTPLPEESSVKTTIAYFECPTSRQRQSQFKTSAAAVNSLSNFSRAIHLFHSFAHNGQS